MLQQFGFTQYESKVYESLVSAGEPLDATSIVKLSGVPRAKVYEVLHRMGEKGMILESTVEKKRLYSALPLESAIEKLKADFDSHINELRKAKVKQAAADDRIWTLKENHSIQALMKSLINNAADSIIISGWSDDFAAYLPLLEEKYLQGAEVTIHVIGEISTTIPTVTTLIPDTNHEQLEKSRILIADGQEMLFAGIEDNKWQAIHTMSRPLVKFFTEFFYHDVALTKITGRYKDTIMKDPDICDLLLALRY
ncbi:TrmB family transcriptional regulator [Pseudobacillus badius]|uniref:TrmB family transcriptional regulator n=1 Tax=Bacillus badius TaxID=1455 RepID=UPI0007B047E3|nr:helix-turn-helix domain-containing protein [Bacillus badius]KZO01834.1 TrmB family transcriptional regulator [Bacillus badius]KZR59486.1 TrmB family transcriptional regulator [Bacillus badius]MED0667510.1 helix-turn-helix domain-containing protein [Bacillus badius]OCS90225.1 TrmB family transcriptional regulator [Bacillus badius]OVE53755.1 TrmB family transcriptional regulator [Bacillus badius]